ncbi:hypothetical protein, partial [Desulfonatronospira thiodismutans]|uniref:hypothetical protein n=1 Tax=Desulfonatronospira thiodismutans TaxID=488939 RepID=UPI001ABF2F5C
IIPLLFPSSAWEHLPDAPRPPMIQHSLLNTIYFWYFSIAKSECWIQIRSHAERGSNKKKKASVSFRVFRGQNFLAFFENETTF